MKLKVAAEKVRDSIVENLSYYDFARAHRIRIRTNNGIPIIVLDEFNNQRAG